MIMSLKFVFTFIVTATASIWFASAKPLLPQQTKAPALDYKNAFVKFMNALANMQINSEEHAYNTGIMNDSEDPATDQLINTAGPAVDEEKINEKTGIAKNPHMHGDILLTPEQEKLLYGGGSEGVAQGFLYVAREWPGGIVPYWLDTRLNSIARRAIRNAISEFEARSCIQFVQRTSQNWRRYPNYVYLTPDNGCYSMLGMIGGRQIVSIGRGCEYKGIVQHEILHALGRVHEQSRPDRDNYVIINRNNIQPELRNNFEIARAATGGLPYDFGSVMHYGLYDFSRNGRPTISPRQSVAVRIGQRDGLSTFDWRHLQTTYCQREE